MSKIWHCLSDQECCRLLQNLPQTKRALLTKAIPSPGYPTATDWWWQGYKDPAFSALHRTILRDHMRATGPHMVGLRPSGLHFNSTSPVSIPLQQGSLVNNPHSKETSGLGSKSFFVERVFSNLNEHLWSKVGPTGLLKNSGLLYRKIKLERSGWEAYEMRGKGLEIKTDVWSVCLLPAELQSWGYCSAKTSKADSFITFFLLAFFSFFVNELVLSDVKADMVLQESWYLHFLMFSSIFWLVGQIRLPSGCRSSQFVSCNTQTSHLTLCFYFLISREGKWLF